MPSFFGIAVDPMGDVRPEPISGVAIYSRRFDGSFCDDQTVEPVNFAIESWTSEEHE
jgi:hypothetical protein